MSPAEAKAIANVFVGGLESEYATTRKVVSALPDGQLDFKLGEKGRTAGELAWHLVASEVWFAKGIVAADFTAEEPPMPPNAKTTDIAALYETLPALLEKVKALPGEHLAEETDFFGIMKMPLVSYLGFWNNHAIHHRGQLSTYLRAMNAHVPSIYGGSADEPFQMPATA